MEPITLSGIFATPFQNPPSNQPCVKAIISEVEFQLETQERHNKLEAVEDKLECMIF